MFKEGQSTAFASLSGLGFTYNVLKETVRKYSLVPVVTRVTQEDDTIAVGERTYFFPSGSNVVVHIKGIHYRPDLWEK